jgi:hypothetical protein
MKSNPGRIVIVTGVVLLALSARMALAGDLAARIPLFLALFGAMFAAYTAAVAAVVRGGAASRRLLIYILVVAAACRLVLVGARPALSTDVYRYLWEGRVVAAGHNPFALPPQSPELEPLRDANYERISHKHMVTIYPPLAQGVFFAGAAIHASLAAQKLLFAMFDLAVIGAIVLWLRARGRPLAWCAVYAWSPLAIVEFAHSGHVDSLGIFFLVLALYLWEIGRKNRTVVAFSLSFLSKYLALLLLPFFALKKGEARRLVIFAAVSVLAYLPFTDAGAGLMSSLRTYGAEWEFNAGFFSLCHSVFGGGAWVRSGLFAALVLFAIIQGRRQDDLSRYTFLVVGCALLLSPTLYPWYVCWILPFLCFSLSPAWLYLSGMVAASYAVWMTYPITGEWTPGSAVLALEYAPFYGLLLWEWARSRRRRSKAMSA